MKKKVPLKPGRGDEQLQSEAEVRAAQAGSAHPPETRRPPARAARELFTPTDGQTLERGVEMGLQDPLL